MKIRYKLVGTANSSRRDDINAVAQQQDEPEVIELPDGATIGDLTRKLNVTANHALLNGGDAGEDSKLKDGDEVTVFGLSAGAM